MRPRWLLLPSLAVIVVAALLIRRIAPHRSFPSETHALPDLSVTNPLNQPGGGAVAAEAYEVYSGLYSGAQAEPLAFAEDSLTDVPQLDGNCLRPANAEEREMSEAFVVANQKSQRWGKRFTISAGYRVLSAAEASGAESCIERHDRESASCLPYKELLHVRFLGGPGFNRAHTRALVSVLKKCGEYCGSGGIFVAEKIGAGWRRAETTEFVRDCSWMY